MQAEEIEARERLQNHHQDRYHLQDQQHHQQQHQQQYQQQHQQHHHQQQHQQQHQLDHQQQHTNQPNNVSSTGRRIISAATIYLSLNKNTASFSF